MILLEDAIINNKDIIQKVMEKSQDKRNNYSRVRYLVNKNKEIEDFLIEYNLTPKELFEIYKAGFVVNRCICCGSTIPNIKNRKFCSKKCSGKYNANLDETKEKIKKTNLKKYGVEYYSQTEERKEKYKQTCQEKYGEGIINVFQVEEVKKKIKETNIEKYGVEYFLQSDKVREKLKQTCLKKYGVEYPNQSQEIVDKRRKTNLEKYGVENYTQTEEYKEKSKQTCLERYGTEYTLQSKEIRNKIIKTHRNNYYNKFIELLNKKNISLEMTKEQYINANTLQFKCNNCGTIIETKETNPQVVCCPKCSIESKISIIEKNLLIFIKSIYSGNIIENDRTILNGKELDIYIPDEHLAIEFDGNYWHSTLFIDKKYHQEKTLLCRENGIRLIHIFEYEWINKQEICKSIIKSALGIYDKRIYARNCTIKSISSSDYRDFLDTNHLQGSINSSIRYGLYYQDELVAIIGFGKSRFKKGEIELHRFCSKLGYYVIGGFSKLIKHSGITNFITYVDLAHFSGEGYKTLGFKELSITEPNYKWIKNNIVLNRLQTQKHKLKDLLENYDDNLTEVENMILNNYNQIYDAGNIKLHLHDANSSANIVSYGIFKIETSGIL